MSTKGKIFVVDDDTAYLQETEALLKEAGYEVNTCSEPSQALSMIRVYQPHCILLDMRMPSMDGQDLLLLVRRKFPDIPVMMCSGVADIDERFLLKSGATTILQKPFTDRALFTAIEQAVSQQAETLPITLRGFNFRDIHNLVSRKIIVKALARANFNITHTAQLLGISRQCLLRYIKRLQISY